MTEWNPLLAMRAAMRNSAGLDRTERDALLVIIDRQPNCCPSAHQFATEAKVHRVTLLQAIARLELKGIIRVERIQGRGSTYHLVPGWEDRITSSVTLPVVSRDRLSSATTPVVSRNKTGSVTLPKESKDTKEKAIPSESFAFATAPADDSPPPSTSKKRKASKAEGKQRPRPKPTAKAPADPRVQVAIDAFAAEYQRQVGHAPSGNDYGKAGALIRQLPRSVSADDICDAVRLQLGPRRLQAYKGKDWNTLSQIVANIDTIRAWVATPSNGYARQPEPECNAGGYRPA